MTGLMIVVVVELLLELLSGSPGSWRSLPTLPLSWPLLGGRRAGGPRCRSGAVFAPAAAAGWSLGGCAPPGGCASGVEGVLWPRPTAAGSEPTQARGRATTLQAPSRCGCEEEGAAVCAHCRRRWPRMRAIQWTSSRWHDPRPQGCAGRASPHASPLGARSQASVESCGRFQSPPHT